MLTGVTDMFYEPFKAESIVEFGGAFVTGIHSMTTSALGAFVSFLWFP
jgi:hypothetical protein